MEGKIISIDIPRGDRTGKPKVLDPAFSSFFVQLPHKLQNCLKSQLKRLAKDNDGIKSLNTFLGKEKGSSAELGINLEKQLQAWRENPSWVNQPPEIKVSVPKGSLCNLKAKVDVGLPPDAVYSIVTDLDNKRVIKNIKVSGTFSPKIVDVKFSIMVQLQSEAMAFLASMFQAVSEISDFYLTN